MEISAGQAANWFMVLARRRLERGVAGEIALVGVAEVGAGHVLVLHAGDALADLLALHALT
jgi:hypothetical protein